MNRLVVDKNSRYTLIVTNKPKESMPMKTIVNGKFVASPFPALPTVQEMNDANDAIRVNFLMLRCLNTSDMGWTYMCLKPETLLDIVDMARSMYENQEKDRISGEFPDAMRPSLNPEETKEFHELCTTFVDYANQHK